MQSHYTDNPIDDFLRIWDDREPMPDVPADGVAEFLSRDVNELMAGWGFTGVTRPLNGSAPFANFRPGAEFPFTFAWHFQGEYNGKDGKSLGGRVPNGQEVQVTGITLVQRTDEGAQVKAYVDWPPLLAQVGLMVSTRPVINVETQAPG